MNDLLEDGLERLSIVTDADMIRKLETYIGEIELFNPVYHLVSYEDRDELVIRHILDCAAGCPVIRQREKEGCSVADLGSGAGFPGIVLSILMPEYRFFLIERMKRRVDFLKNVVLRCNLGNVEVISYDVKDVRREFDCVTFRAFHPLYDMIGDAHRLLAKGGALYAYKARQSYVEAETEGLEGFDSELVRMRVPFLDEVRHMLILRKKGE